MMSTIKQTTQVSILSLSLIFIVPCNSWGAEPLPQAQNIRKTEDFESFKSKINDDTKFELMTKKEALHYLEADKIDLKKVVYAIINRYPFEKFSSKVYVINNYLVFCAGPERDKKGWGKFDLGGIWYDPYNKQIHRMSNFRVERDKIFSYPKFSKDGKFIDPCIIAEWPALENQTQPDELQEGTTLFIPVGTNLSTTRWRYYIMKKDAADKFIKEKKIKLKAIMKKIKLQELFLKNLEDVVVINQHICFLIGSSFIRGFAYNIITDEVKSYNISCEIYPPDSRYINFSLDDYRIKVEYDSFDK